MNELRPDRRSDAVSPSVVPMSALSPGYQALEDLLAWRERLLDPPAPWTEHPEALDVVRRTVTVELRLRGVSTDELGPVTPPASLEWPEVRPETLAEELTAVRRSGGGRIVSPDRITDLWAQHKYSVMARDPRRGREIGGRLGAQDPNLDEATLLPELVAFLRTPPRAGTLRDAVMHMWGYVSPVARSRGIVPDYEDIPATVAVIAEIALEEPRSYLAASTALSDLTVWGLGI